MKKLCILILLTACSYRYAPMNEPAFQHINTGTPISAVEQKYGQPNAIHSRNNQYIYEYSFQDYNGTDPVRKVRYFFIVENGIIKSKYLTMTDGPAFDLLVDPSPP